MESRIEILSEFGFSKDPFRGFYMETADSLRIKRLLKMAVESKAMVSIVAPPGLGKTVAVDTAIRELSPIKLLTPDKERVLIGDIERALIDTLSQESPKRTREIRARQLRRILGEASRQKSIILVLEEAHRMHGQTLRSLKTLREFDWMGVYPLFTVVMIGQYDPMRKRGLDEVRLRTDTVTMKGITASEIKDYISATVDKHFDGDAIDAISRLGDARNFLDLQEIIINLMSRAIEVGQKKVTVLEVFDLYGGGLKEVMRRTNVTLKEIEDATGISKTTLSMVASEKQGTLTDQKFIETRQAIAEVLRKKADGQSALKAVQHG